MRNIIFLLTAVSAVKVFTLRDLKKSKCDRPIKLGDRVTLSWEVMNAAEPKRIKDRGLLDVILNEQKAFEGWTEALTGMCEDNVKRFKVSARDSPRAIRNIKNNDYENDVIFEVHIHMYKPGIAPKDEL